MSQEPEKLEKLEKPELVKAVRNSQRGFTLLEVIVTVAILAIALVAILKANVQNLETLTDSREKTTAMLLCASKLAEIESAGVSRLTGFRGDFGDEYPGFVWEVETQATRLKGLMRVTVSVHEEGQDAGRQARLEELIFVK